MKDVLAVNPTSVQCQLSLLSNITAPYSPGESSSPSVSLSSEAPNLMPHPLWLPLKGQPPSHVAQKASRARIHESHRDAANREVALNRHMSTLVAILSGLSAEAAAANTRLRLSLEVVLLHASTCSFYLQLLSSLR